MEVFIEAGKVNILKLFMKFSKDNLFNFGLGVSVKKASYPFTSKNFHIEELKAGQSTFSFLFLNTPGCLISNKKERGNSLYSRMHSKICGLILWLNQFKIFQSGGGGGF